MIAKRFCAVLKHYFFHKEYLEIAVPVLVYHQHVPHSSLPPLFLSNLKTSLYLSIMFCQDSIVILHHPMKTNAEKQGT